MPEYLYAFVVVAAIALGYFVIARSALLELLPEATFTRWRNLWIGATALLFLSHSVWIYFVMLGGVLLAIRRLESQVVGLYFTLLLASPAVGVEIPGFGIVDHIWVLDHYRLLAVCLLLPCAITLLQRGSTPKIGTSPVDWMVLGYVILMSLLPFREGNVTSAFRSMVSVWIDIFLPYFVASRSIRDQEGFRHALTGFLIAAMLTALLAIFEALRHWKLYQPALAALRIGENFYGAYLTRGGFLRPSVTVVSPIVVGYVLVVALGFLLYLRAFVHKAWHRWAAFGLLSIGILASLSRGPWVGAMFLMFLYSVSGPRAIRQLTRYALWSAVTLVLASQFTVGRTFVNMLPIIGEAEQENVEYRANLITAAMPVIERNLLFGSHDFLSAPEMQVMIQGEGIIDVVNTYVGVALYSGLVGLALFVGAFLLAIAGVRRGVRQFRSLGDATASLLGRALWVTLATIMLIIYTVSSVTAVPSIYWSVVGLCVAYYLSFREAKQRPDGSVVW